MSTLHRARSIKGNAGKHEAALRGLAQKEDFDGHRGRLKPSTRRTPVKYPEFYHPMLIKISTTDKGLISHTVLPDQSSITDDSSVVLVEQRKLYIYHGANSTCREEARQVASQIKDRNQHGVRGATAVEIDVKRNVNHAKAEFHSALDNSTFKEASGVDYPETVTDLIAAYKVYTVDDGKLCLDDSLSGKRPNKSMLETDKVLVFDFLSEVYVYKSKAASLSECREAIKYAKEELLEDNARPAWTIFKKISQNLETKLFLGKFV